MIWFLVGVVIGVLGYTYRFELLDLALKVWSKVRGN